MFEGYKLQLERSRVWRGSFVEHVRWLDPSRAFLLIAEKEQGRAEQELHFHQSLPDSLKALLIRPASKFLEKTYVLSYAVMMVPLVNLEIFRAVSKSLLLC